MKVRVAFAAAMVAALFSVSADAAHWGKPGLWQTTSTMQMSRGMPVIPAAQLARMKKMGVKVPDGSPRSIDAKVCITAAETENFDTERYAQKTGGCKQTSVTRTGGRIVSTVVCNGRMKGTGRAEVTVADDSHYSTVFSFKGTGASGRPLDMKVSTTAHWLGASCGSVKPFSRG